MQSSQDTLDDLVPRIQQGDPNALAALHSAVYAEMWHFARSIIHDSDAASDVVQSVFIDIWNRRTSWIVRDSVRAYLFGAIRNRALHESRSASTALRVAEKLGAQNPSTAEPNNPISDIEAADMTVMLRRVLDALPERQRSAMLLRWNNGLNSTEIGRALGISDTAARKLLAKGDAILREVYDRNAK